MSCSQRIKDYFNALAPNWSAPEDESAAREAIVERAHIAKGSVVADIGCGRGVMIPCLLKTEPRELIEIDLSDEMIRLAREQWTDARIRFMADNIMDCVLPTLDCAIIFNAYPHIMHKDRLCENLAKHIRKDGFFVIAHSRGRDFINSHHTGKTVSTVSIPLKSAAEEYENFKEFFELEDFYDEQDGYFIKLKRR